MLEHGEEDGILFKRCDAGMSLSKAAKPGIALRSKCRQKHASPVESGLGFDQYM